MSHINNLELDAFKKVYKILKFYKKKKNYKKVFLEHLVPSILNNLD